MSTRSGPELGGEAASTGRPARRPKTLKARSNAWLRWLHIYTSMISLLVVLFFSVTGITLNHPDWNVGGGQRRATLTGTLPASAIVNGKPEWLTVVEYLRAQHNLSGQAGDYSVQGQQAFFSYRGPGYSADVTVDDATRKYSIDVEAQGTLAVLNDLHRGRDSGSAWSWLIDVSGGFLTVIALTGLALLLYLKKVRAAALITVAAGSVLTVVLMHLASR